MRLDTVLFADAASAIGGKLYIHGGGITRIEAPTFPWTHPQLAIVVRLEVEDRDRERWAVEAPMLSVALRDPDGKDLIETVALPLRGDLPPPSGTEEPRYLHMVLTAGPLEFAREGVFELELGLGEEPLRTVPLFVVPA